MPVYTFMTLGTVDGLTTSDRKEDLIDRFHKSSRQRMQTPTEWL